MDIENKNFWKNDYLILDPDGPKRKAASLLTGIEVIGDSIIFGPIKLRSVDPGVDSVFNSFRKDDPQRSVLELNYIDRGKVLSMYAEPSEVILRSFRAIQLLVDNWIGMSTTYHFDANGKSIGKLEYMHFETADTQELRTEGKLNSKNTISKKNFIETYEAQNDGSLSHAIKRFSRACTEIKEESILDFVIVLEGILGYGLRVEIGHRLSCRGALLLAQKHDQRMHYYKVLKYLYDIRCSIAHGNEVEAAFKLKQDVKESIVALGYQLEGWEKTYYRSYIIADIARKITRAAVLKFIADPSMLNSNLLTRLELGIK